MKNTLFDEKIDGTVHLALGNGLPESGGTNQSEIHWDIVKDLRPGGQIFLDGEVVQQDGVWTILVRLAGHRPGGDDVRGEQDERSTSVTLSRPAALALPQAVDADAADDEGDEQHERAGVGDDVADVEPARKQLVGEVVPRPSFE